jgi:hypothetical protein
MIQEPSKEVALIAKKILNSKSKKGWWIVTVFHLV